MSLYGSAFAQQAGRGVSGGTITVTPAQASATQAIIDTGMGSVEAQVIDVLRAGVVVTSTAVITKTAGKITVANGAGYTMASGDVINYIAWGKRRER